MLGNFPKDIFPRATSQVTISQENKIHCPVNYRVFEKNDLSYRINVEQKTIKEHFPTLHQFKIRLNKT